MNRRVFITGMGVVSPIGNNLADFWKAILEGRSGVGPITRFDVSEYPARIAGEVRDFDVTAFVEKKDARRMDLSEQYAVGAAVQAVEDSRLDLKSVDLDRCGVVIGSGIGGIGTFATI